MNRRSAPKAFLLLAAAVLALAAPLRAADAPPDVAALASSLPDCGPDGKYAGPTPEVAEKAVLDVLKGGKASLTALLDLMKEPAKGQDYKAVYLFHAIATRARQPEAEDERRLVCEALTTALADGRSPLAKTRLLEELKWIGGKESVDVIAKFLLDAELSDFAAQALVAIQAAEPLRAALPQAKGAPRLNLIQALGVLRAAKGVPEVLQALGDGDRDVQLAAGHALANSADPAAVEPLLKAMETESPYEKGQVIVRLLLLARRLGAAGDKKDAERICRHLRETQKDAVHVQCAVLFALAEALGDDAMDDILAATSSENATLRAAALEAAITMPGAKATEHWVKRLEAAPAASKAGILSILARRGDPAALPAVLQAAKDADPAVRVAALQAVGSLGNETAVAPLTALLATEDGAVRAAARHALTQVRGAAVDAAVAKSLSAVSPEVRAALLDVLAARDARECLDAVAPFIRDGDRRVAAAAIPAVGRLADRPDQLKGLTALLVETDTAPVRAAAERALTDACRRIRRPAECVAVVYEPLGKATGAARASLLRVLGTIGGAEALGAVRAGLRDADPQVQEAALRALAEWPSDEPAAELLALARATDKLNLHVLALRGYATMIGLNDQRPAAERLQMCRDALAACRRPEEKRLVLGALASVPAPEALPMAEACLQDAALKDEAAMTILRVARLVAGSHPSEAKEAVQRALAATQNKDIRKQGEKLIYEMERTEDFLTAWQIAGPYPGGIGSKEVFPPEKPDAKGVKWTPLQATQGREPGIIDLHRAVRGDNNICAYLRCQVWSPKEQPARFEAGSDDGLKMWLNGALVYEKDVPRSLKVNDDQVPVKLKEGWNALLIRVSEGGGNWEVCIRLRAADGAKLPGLKFKAE